MCSSQSSKRFRVDYILFANTKYLCAKISLNGTVTIVHYCKSNMCVLLYVVNTNLHSIAIIINMLLICSNSVLRTQIGFLANNAGDRDPETMHIYTCIRIHIIYAYYYHYYEHEMLEVISTQMQENRLERDEQIT